MNTQTRIIRLKTWPEYFIQVLQGFKKFEFRKNDRNFKVGDLLLLEEFLPASERYTGRSKLLKVTYILTDMGVPDGYCIMSLAETNA